MSFSSQQGTFLFQSSILTTSDNKLLDLIGFVFEEITSSLSDWSMEE